MTTSGSRWTRSTSWDALASRQLPDGSKVCGFKVGDVDDEGAPTVLRVEFPPGATLPAHFHATDYAEIVLEGSQQVGHVWHRVGDIRIVKAGTGYGPLTAGSEGVTVLIVFRTSDWRPRGRSVERAVNYSDVLAEIGGQA